MNIKNILFAIVTVSLFSCAKKERPVPAYKISKVLKTDSVTTVNVHIDNRMDAAQLVFIAAKLKKDSSQLQNIKISFLLPGNTDISSGENSYYASARFIRQGEITAGDTLKDEEGNTIRLKIFGLSEVQVKHLLSLQPKEIAGKHLLGKYIDDYNHTVIIPFNDPADKKREVYVIELDSAAKVVSATVPILVKDGPIEKWIVTQHGDYMVLKDSVLSQYPVDGLGIPFNSIKSGI